MALSYKNQLLKYVLCIHITASMKSSRASPVNIFLLKIFPGVRKRRYRMMELLGLLHGAEGYLNRNPVCKLL